MKDSSETNKALTEELASLRQRIGELEQSEAERKKIEDVLRESEEKFRRITENISDLVCEVDAQAKYQYISPSYQRILGYSPQDLIGDSIFDRVHPEDRESVIAVFIAGVRNATDKTFEFRYQRADGNYVWLRSSGHSLSGVPGELFGAIVNSSDITEQKKTEEVVRSAKKWFEDVVEFMPDAIVIADKDLKIIAWNRAVENMTGIPKAAIMGLDHHQATVGFYGEVRKSLIDLVFVDDEELAAKYSHVRRVDSTLYAETFTPAVYNNRGAHVFAAVSPFYDEEGNLVGIIESIRDITEFKRAEEALREGEQRYRILAENASDIIWTLDLNLRFTYASPSIEKQLGWTVEEIKSLYLQDILTPASLDRVIKVFEEESALEKMSDIDPKRSRTMELEEYRKDGSTIWIEATASFLRDNEGNALGILGISRDITERKRAAEEHVRLVTAIEQTAEGIVISDTNWIIKYVNPAFERMTGFSRSDIIDQHSRLLKSDKHDKAFYKKIRDTVSQGNIWSGRAINKRKDGILYEAEVMVSPVRDKSGVTINHVAIHRDITREVKLENELRQMQKMEAIGTLAGGIAHDFNNILSAIIGFTDMALTDPKVDDRLRRYLNQVYTAGERARDLVKQILAFSRQSDQKPRPVRISSIINEVLKLLRASLPTTITIHQDVQSEPDMVLADPSQIHQILMNLCTNAAHAMRETKGELKISLVPLEVKPDDTLSIHHSLIPGMHLKLTVSDTGHGIEPVIMERIFDPFFTTKKPGEGTGMGLSVVHGIVKSYHGAITVESGVGKGTEFHVYLPLLKETREKREVAAVAGVTGGKERILFVDDEEVLVQLGKDMLTGLGYEVIGSTRSLEALKLFQASPDRFDLVITDMTMPYMTGIELAQEIMRIRPGMPIILCTGFSEEITPEYAKALGLREFIMKPTIKNQIAEAIRRVLNQKG